MILKERARSFSGLTSAINYRLTPLCSLVPRPNPGLGPLCVSVVPLHAETISVQIVFFLVFFFGVFFVFSL